MCGISGQTNFDATDSVSTQSITQMTDAMAHREPDDAGQFISANVGLDFRRPSTIDVSGCHQAGTQEFRLQSWSRLFLDSWPTQLRGVEQ
jgi:asparagine synthetase B (glutamine-hydrolysing)